jgi:predicted hydrocarbon binding protein
MPTFLIICLLVKKGKNIIKIMVSPNGKFTVPGYTSFNIGLAHCSSFQDIAMGNSFPARDWLGRLIGRFVKPIFYNDKPLPQNMSTIQSILIADEKEFLTEKKKLKQKIITFQNNDSEKCKIYPHPFFGKLTIEQWGKGIYKHLDHHLKQFEV